MTSEREKAFESKYSSSRIKRTDVGEAKRSHDAELRCFFRFRPDLTIMSWDDRRLEVR